MWLYFYRDVLYIIKDVKRLFTEKPEIKDCNHSIILSWLILIIMFIPFFSIMAYSCGQPIGGCNDKKKDV